MFQFLTAQIQGVTVGKDLITVLAVATVASAFVVVRMLVNVILKGKRNFDLSSFYGHIRLNLTEKLRGLLVNQTPHKLGAVVWIAKFSTVPIQVPAELFVHGIQSREMAHGYASANVIADVATSNLLEDVDVALTVKQTSYVLNVHKFLQVVMRMVVNSEKTRCPAGNSAEGQPRAKQAALPLGVCNEHVPPPEGKMCSELHGNMQRLAEMTNLIDVLVGVIGTSVGNRMQYEVPSLASAFA